MIVRKCGYPGVSTELCRFELPMYHEVERIKTRFSCSCSDGTSTSGWIRVSTFSPAKFWKDQQQQSRALINRRSMGSVDRRRGSNELKYLPPARALSPREKAQQSRSRDDYPPPTRMSPRPPTSDLEDDLDELPSLYKSRRRGSPTSRENSAATGGEGAGGYGPRNGGTTSASPFRFPNLGINKYVFAGIFVIGMGAGIALDTVISLEPNNVASREVIDRQTPNPDVCIANGMSAMVLDQRLFITFNPFNVYVSQAEVKPGCVLLQSNWRVLESRGLVNSEEVRDCKRNFNTFGFVGDLRQAPEINCVYHSENAENQFLKDPSKAALGDGFQPKDFKEP